MKYQTILDNGQGCNRGKG